MVLHKTEQKLKELIVTEFDKTESEAYSLVLAVREYAKDCAREVIKNE